MAVLAHNDLKMDACRFGKHGGHDRNYFEGLVLPPSVFVERVSISEANRNKLPETKPNRRDSGLVIVSHLVRPIAAGTLGVYNFQES